MAPRLDKSTLGDFLTLLHEAIGIRIHPAARLEFERHLSARLEALQLKKPDQYLAALRAGSEEELRGLIDAVVPRAIRSLRAETGPLEFLRGWFEGRGETRVWCAGFGGGDEPEVLAELAHANGTRIEIIATDVHTGVIDRARAEPCAHTRYLRHNLLDATEQLGSFDAVLLRHVLDDFDVPTRASVLERVHDTLQRDGIVVLGESENLLHVEHRFRYLRPSVFLRTMNASRTDS